MEQYKKAFQDAQQELEGKEVEHLKGVIKTLLENKKKKEKERDEIDDQIRVIKQDIDDFKAGRLDKIKERHEVNTEADRSLPISIRILNDGGFIHYPTQPWRWNYSLTYPTSTIGTFGSAFSTINLSGSTAATFTTGTYHLGDTTVSL